MEDQMTQQMGYDDDESAEDGFMQGYSEEERVEECAECGEALHKKAVVKTVEGEKIRFCSDSCAEDFMDSL